MFKRALFLKKKKQKTLSCPQIMNHSFSFLLFQPYSTLIFTVVSSFSLSNPFQPLYVAFPLGTSLVHFNTLLNSEFNTHLWIDPTAALITTAQHCDIVGDLLISVTPLTSLNISVSGTFSFSPFCVLSLDDFSWIQPPLFAKIPSSHSL